MLTPGVDECLNGEIFYTLAEAEVLIERWRRVVRFELRASGVIAWRRMAGLIPQETREMIGQPLSAPVTETISGADARRFALAVGDHNPIYHEEAAAQAAGYRTLVVHPVFLGASGLTPPRPLEDLKVDGLYKATGRPVRLNVERIMFGGEEWDLLAPAYVGDTITAETRLRSLEEKSGSSGPFVLQSLETTYTNQDGELVARTRTQGIAR